MTLPEITGPGWLNPYQTDEDVDTVGYGPLVCSSCTALLPSPQLCWDVNGYYRTLGVHWRATKKELREAYDRINGQGSAYATYVLKQLLNPAVRIAYDSSKLGEPFLDDVYVQEDLKRKAAQEAGRRSQSGVSVTPDMVLQEQGLRVLDDTFEEALDGDRFEWSDDRPDWRYSFYIWDTSDTSGYGLDIWQHHLVTALSTWRREISFAVGFHAKDSRYTIVRWVEDTPVFFLRVDMAPSKELAEAAVKEYLILKSREGVIHGRSTLEAGR